MCARVCVWFPQTALRYPIILMANWDHLPCGSLLMVHPARQGRSVREKKTSSLLHALTLILIFYRHRHKTREPRESKRAFGEHSGQDWFLKCVVKQGDTHTPRGKGEEKSICNLWPIFENILIKHHHHHRRLKIILPSPITCSTCVVRSGGWWWMRAGSNRFGQRADSSHRAVMSERCWRVTAAT